MKTATYHEDAIKYNAALAEKAEELSLTLEDETVKQWCASVGRQHRFHENRHQSALDKMRAAEVNVENTEQKDS